MGVGRQDQEDTLVANLLARLVREDEGQDLIEYVFLTGLISVSVVSGLSLVGVSLAGWYDSVADLVAVLPTNVADLPIDPVGED